MISKEDVLAQALALPPADQEYVADMLERRITAGQFHSPEIGKLWSNEINRRIAAYDRGETSAMGFEDSVDRTRNLLRNQKSDQRHGHQ